MNRYKIVKKLSRNKRISMCSECGYIARKKVEPNIKNKLMKKHKVGNKSESNLF